MKDKKHLFWKIRKKHALNVDLQKRYMYIKIPNKKTKKYKKNLELIVKFYCRSYQKKKEEKEKRFQKKKYMMSNE